MNLTHESLTESIIPLDAAARQIAQMPVEYQATFFNIFAEAVRKKEGTKYLSMDKWRTAAKNYLSEQGQIFLQLFKEDEVQYEMTKPDGHYLTYQEWKNGRIFSDVPMQYLNGGDKIGFIEVTNIMMEQIKELSRFDLGGISDGYHTFNELYEFRMLYNAALFNEWYRKGCYNVHKSERHSDGELCFGGGWFIVMATLPTGQISNHYEMKEWERFQCKVEEKAEVWDSHTAQDVAERLSKFTYLIIPF